MPRGPDLAKLEKRLNYRFSKQDLLREALTHRSASAQNNERLEFLGDSILNFVIAAELFTRFPDSPEGDLSRLRASLVNKDGLYKVASELQLGDFLILGSGELKSGGYRRNSILADTVEAIFGAAYLDSNFEECRKLILALYHEQLEHVPDANSLKDPKTRLQELLQSRKLNLPTYTVTEVTGQAHNQQFRVNCAIDEFSLTAEGVSTSRRKAEQLAAEKAIQLVEKNLLKKEFK